MCEFILIDFSRLQLLQEAIMNKSNMDFVIMLLNILPALYLHLEVDVKAKSRIILLGNIHVLHNPRLLKREDLEELGKKEWGSVNWKRWMMAAFYSLYNQ